MKDNSDIKCAMYCRYSSFLQRDTSIKDQMHANEAFANARGWKVLKEHIYIDRCTKGTKELRKGLDELLQATKSGNPGFNYILVYDTSRFSRSLHRTSIETEGLAYKGINVYFVSQGIDSADKSSRLMIAFRGIIDHESNEQLSKNSKRGVKGQVERGYSGGGVPYGYFSEPVFNNTDNSKPAGHILKVDIAKAETIKLIYTSYGEEKMSQTAIVNFLTQEYKNKNIHKPPKGSFWRTSTIHGILSHPIYRGLYQWNVKSKLKHPITGIEKLILNPESEWTKQQREDLRIVTDELWEKVAFIREANTRKSGGKFVQTKRLFSKHLLTSLTDCSECKGTFSIVSGGKAYAKYGCSTHHQSGSSACNNFLKLNRNLFEQAVIDVLCEELVKEEQVAHILNETHKTLELLLLENFNKNTLQQIAVLEKEINNISSAIKTGENIKVRPETLLLELSQTEVEKSDLERRMITPDTNTAFNVQELITLKDLRAHFEALINDLKTSEKNKESLPKAIGKVVVHPKDEATAEIELLENTEITGSYILETVSKRDTRIRFATGTRYQPYTSRIFKIFLPAAKKRLVITEVQPDTESATHISCREVSVPKILFQEVDVNLIDHNPDQLRKLFDGDSIQELAQSIKALGVIQPIILYKNGERFVIISGERRYRAVKLVGTKTIPAIIRDQRNAEAVSLIENIQRENLAPVEECLGIKKLLDKGMRQREVAGIIGKSQTYISKAKKIIAFAIQYCNIDKLATIKRANGERLTLEHLYYVASRPSFESGCTLLNEILMDSLPCHEVRKKIQKRNTTGVATIFKRLALVRKYTDLAFLKNFIVNEQRDRYQEELKDVLCKFKKAQEIIEEIMRSFNL